jgi:hypothetical protein
VNAKLAHERQKDYQDSLQVLTKKQRVLKSSLFAFASSPTSKPMTSFNSSIIQNLAEKQPFLKDPFLVGGSKPFFEDTPHHLVRRKRKSNQTGAEPREEESIKLHQEKNNSNNGSSLNLLEEYGSSTSSDGEEENGTLTT